LGTKIVDAVGRCIVQLDEIEKGVEQTEFGGGKQSGGGAVADLIGHMLTWMQERKSEAIVVATSNNLNALPPEFIRAGRWDRIFFVGLPNPYEIQSVIKIQNRKHHAELPEDLEFCKELYKGKWSPAEIEQLAKDSHYDDLESAMKKIPILAQYKAKEIDKIVEDGKKYCSASIEYSETVNTKRKVMLQ
jgi:SpoVK/Ycf46/Vps4 family AAA+-type ATPase